MYEALFHPAFWMPAALAVVGLAIFIYGNARVQTTVRNVGLGVIALTLAWCGVAHAIDTPVEQCVKRTNAIVSAVENGKWDDLKPLLDKNTVIDRLNARGPAAVTSIIEANSEAYGLKSIHVLGTDVTRGVGTYDVTLNTLLEGSQSTTARFTFQYEQRTDGILLARLVPISVGTLSVEDFSNYIKNHAGAFGR